MGSQEREKLTLCLWSCSLFCIHLHTFRYYFLLKLKKIIHYNDNSSDSYLAKHYWILTRCLGTLVFCLLNNFYWNICTYFYKHMVKIIKPYKSSIYKWKLIFASTPESKSMRVDLSTDSFLLPSPLAYLTCSNQSLHIRHCVEFWGNNGELIHLGYSFPSQHGTTQKLNIHR